MKLVAQALWAGLGQKGDREVVWDSWANHGNGLEFLRHRKLTLGGATGGCRCCSGGLRLPRSSAHYSRTIAGLPLGPLHGVTGMGDLPAAEDAEVPPRHGAGAVSAGLVCPTMALEVQTMLGSLQTTATMGPELT